MGFKIKQKGKGAEVKIMKSEQPELVGKFGIIQRIRINTQTAIVKLVDGGGEVEIKLNDLLLP